MCLSATFQWFCKTENYVPYKVDFTDCRVGNPYTVRAKFHTEIKAFILRVRKNCVEWANRTQAKLCFVLVTRRRIRYAERRGLFTAKTVFCFCGLHDFTNPELYIKSEKNNVAVLHNVFLALGADFALFFCRLHGAKRH